MLPKTMVDACDYEVENYAVGMYGTRPALCKMGKSKSFLVLDEEGGVLTAPFL